MSLFRRRALMCLLANDFDEKDASNLIEALCQEHGIRLLKVSTWKILH